MRAIRDAALGIVAAIIVLGAYLAIDGYFDARLAARVATGQRVTATVVDVSTYWEGRNRAPRIVVSYSLNNREDRAPLMWLVAPADDRAIKAGDSIDIYVDDRNPMRIATSDHAGSEGWLLRIPADAAAVLFAAVLGATMIRIRWHLSE